MCVRFIESYPESIELKELIEFLSDAVKENIRLNEKLWVINLMHKNTWGLVSG